ncbi:phosphohistidine phosphatase [Actinopolyspora mzabensis]|uniref:Phosphohistidine phosphatase n=1 Tax=Actinopolyspora mzabensis TaxID=995066 RepID=A0A1G8Z8V0_ACTMZ|nr:histidine phosphatase family protein [Actinopolyspora mzabensis]SDK11478.1 phosphohistidine phosphatase [Actinopolyspora mzabensis]
MRDRSRGLVVVRHAKSDRTVTGADHDRPLAARGRREAPLAGEWLREQEAAVDLVRCSTATRARQTGELLLPELSGSPRLEHDPRLYGADTTGLLEVVHDLPAEYQVALLIAHNPGLEELVALLTGTSIELKTSGVAVLRTSGTWSEAGAGWAELAAHATPRPPEQL